MERIVIQVHGMSGQYCEMLVRQALYALLGVSKVVVDLAGSRVVIDYLTKTAEPVWFCRSIESLGFEVA